MEIYEIDIEDDDYPNKLRKIKNPPSKLYVIGNKEILNNNGFAIVGTRDCTEEGVRNAKFFAANIAKSGFTVISGMARGIDAAAHTRSLRSKRKNNCSFRLWTRCNISRKKCSNL